MSRCFSYPPPGFTPSKANEETLKRLINLQKAKEQRKKEKRRQRKEKRNQESDIAKGTDRITANIWRDITKEYEFLHKTSDQRDEIMRKQKSNIAKGTELITENIWTDTKSDSTEESEKSSITEENGEAVRLLTLSSSSESTENNSNKRKRHNQDDTCLTPCKIGTKKSTMTKLEFEYKNLIVDWVPPQLNDYSEEGLSWLFKKGEERVEKRPNMPSFCSRTMVAVWPPRAQYFPDIGVYALPYTVPF